MDQADLKVGLYREASTGGPLPGAQLPVAQRLVEFLGVHTKV